MSPAGDRVTELGVALQAPLEAAERVLKRFGVGDWKLTLIVRGELAGEWVVLTKDQLAVVGERLQAALAQERGG